MIRFDGEHVPLEVCPSNERFSECGSPCEASCETDLAALSCIAACKAGCFCEKGLVRDANGRCIPKAECTLSRFAYGSHGIRIPSLPGPSEKPLPPLPAADPCSPNPCGPFKECRRIFCITTPCPAYTCSSRP